MFRYIEEKRSQKELKEIVCIGIGTIPNFQLIFSKWLNFDQQTGKELQRKLVGKSLVLFE